MKSTLASILTSLAVLMLIGGCSKEAPAYSHFEQIGSEGWDPGDIIIFEPWAADSTAAERNRYDMELVARLSARSAATGIPIALTFEDADGHTDCDTLILDMKRAETRLGVREVRLKLGTGMQIAEGTTVSLSPLCSAEKSKGMLNIGIIMTETH